MSSELIVRFNPQQEWRIDLSRLEPMGMEEARRWLDDQFTAMECEPLRASGKVLLADKVLLVAQAAGPRRLDDADWRTAYARATHAILVKPMITIDVAAMAVTYQATKPLSGPCTPAPQTAHPTIVKKCALPSGSPLGAAGCAHKARTRAFTARLAVLLG